MMRDAVCGKCGEHFVPADDTDTIHIERLDGVECGGQGELLGYYEKVVERPITLTPEDETAIKDLLGR